MQDIIQLTQIVWQRFNVQAVFLTLNNQPWTRISANVYNTIEDYERLGNAVLALLAEDVIPS